MRRLFASLLVGAALLAPAAARGETPSERRAACKFGPGAPAHETLGVSRRELRKLPIDYVIVVTQENRSFDHYFGKLAEYGQPDAEGWPEGWSNPDGDGVRVPPHHLASTCLEHGPPHQWGAMHKAWEQGAMTGFVKNAAVSAKTALKQQAKDRKHGKHRKRTPSDGHYSMGYYDGSDIPFYYWLSTQYAISDRQFSSVMAGTWPNRAFMYTGSSGGVKDTIGPSGANARAFKLPQTRSIFHEMSLRWVPWGVFTDGSPRQDVLGWGKPHAGVRNFATFLRQLKSGTLPRVSFVDPGSKDPITQTNLHQDEHPPHNVQDGEAFARTIYEAAVASPLWPRMALIYTYDEGGAMFDHVPPPTACAATPPEAEVTQLGFRVPLIVVSPYARRHYVSHEPREHTAILRLIEALYDLPALTARDANSDALLDLFDFSSPQPTPANPPAAGVNGCAAGGSDLPDEDYEDEEDEDEAPDEADNAEVGGAGSPAGGLPTRGLDDAP